MEGVSGRRLGEPRLARRRRMARGGFRSVGRTGTGSGTAGLLQAVRPASRNCPGVAPRNRLNRRDRCAWSTKPDLGGDVGRAAGRRSIRRASSLEAATHHVRVRRGSRASAERRGQAAPAPRRSAGGRPDRDRLEQALVEPGPQSFGEVRGRRRWAPAHRWRAAAMSAHPLRHERQPGFGLEPIVRRRSSARGGRETGEDRRIATHRPVDGCPITVLAEGAPARDTARACGSRRWLRLARRGRRAAARP